MPVDATAPDLRATYRRRFEQELVGFAERHRRIYHDAGEVDEQLWADRAEDVIFQTGKATATDFGRLVYAQLQGRCRWPSETRFRPEAMDAWIHEVAGNVGTAMAVGLAADLEDEDDSDGVFDRFRVGMVLAAVSLTTTFANFGAHDGARAAGAVAKRWQVNSVNPRSSHAALDGETITLGQRFSNGLRWPGDRSGGDVDDRAGCQCSLVFTEGR